VEKQRRHPYLQVNMRKRAISGLTNDLASLDARIVTSCATAGIKLRFSKDDSHHKLGFKHSV